MRIHDVIVGIEATIQDAQRAIGKAPSTGDVDVRFTQLRVELDGLWNALKMLAVEFDRHSTGEHPDQ